MNVPDEIRKLQTIVDGYIVGGSLRDILMGKEPKDYDMATPYTPDKVKQILQDNGYKIIPIGEKFGTIMTFAGEYPVDITTFREEKYDYKSRKPEVSYVKDIRDDLGRRDFTINAMAVDSKGELIDPYNGENALKSREIAFVGNANERITEDPLRMLRACRFSARMGFDVAEQSLEAIKKDSDELARISRERIVEELKKSSDNFSRMFQCLTDTNQVKQVFDIDVDRMKEIRHDSRGRHHNESIYEHTVEVLDCLDKKQKDNLPLKMAGMFHDVGKIYTEQRTNDKVTFIRHEDYSSDACKSSLDKLKGLSTDEMKETCWLVGQHIRYPNLSDRAIAREAIDWKLSNVKPKWIRDLTDLTECDIAKDEESLYNKVITAYNTPRPDGSKFMHIPESERANAIRSKWIEDAGKRL